MRMIVRAATNPGSTREIRVSCSGVHSITAGHAAVGQPRGQQRPATTAAAEPSRFAELNQIAEMDASSDSGPLHQPSPNTAAATSRIRFARKSTATRRSAQHCTFLHPERFSLAHPLVKDRGLADTRRPYQQHRSPSVGGQQPAQHLALRCHGDNAARNDRPAQSCGDGIQRRCLAARFFVLFPSVFDGSGQQYGDRLVTQGRPLSRSSFANPDSVQSSLRRMADRTCSATNLSMSVCGLATTVRSNAGR